MSSPSYFFEFTYIIIKLTDIHYHKINWYIFVHATPNQVFITAD